MKNEYAKFVKYLEKQNNIFVQRADDEVYLTDGKVVLMVPVILYNTYVKPLSGILPELTEDGTGCKRANDYTVNMGDGMDIKKVVDCMNTDYIVKESRFLVEIPIPGKKKHSFARMFYCEGGDYITVNDDYVDMFTGIASGSNWTGAGKWNAPIIRATDGFKVVIFPIKLADGTLDFWKNLEV